MNRDDNALKLIAGILHREDLLSKEDAGTLLFDFGDIVDDSPNFPEKIRKAHNALANLQADPKDAWLRLLDLYGTMRHLRWHMRRAMYTIDKATAQMHVKYPFLVPDEDDDDDEDE